ncbi:MAG: glycosyltransferase family 2 protein [Candidatus Magasanikbacteria bacterium]|nr:glycosyltransferase family 2 protein [Candidatus Magasanikbacteria bacterium]
MLNTISVIIPNYNHAYVLMRALESVAGQNRKDIEIIVVDDGSDETQKEHLRKKIMPQWPQVKFIFSSHAGAATARNSGFRESIGEYVIFWDADIAGQPDMLAKMKKALDEHPEASYAYSSFKFGWKKFVCGQFDAERLKQMNFITTTSLIRREHFPGFDESLKKFQDWDLWLTLLDQSHIGVWVPEVLFHIALKGTMSQWLPSFVYHFPWLPLSAIKKYFYWKTIVQKKHGINANSH